MVGHVSDGEDLQILASNFPVALNIGHFPKMHCLYVNMVNVDKKLFEIKNL